MVLRDDHKSSAQQQAARQAIERAAVPRDGRLKLGEALRVAGQATQGVARADVPKKRRGIALLMVMVIVAIVGSMSIQFTYNTRTTVWMTGNMMASTQAYFHARSAMQIGLLAVNAKKSFPQMKQYLSMMGKAAAQRLEIWQRACDFVKIFATGKAEFFGFSLLDFSEEEAVGGKSLIDGVAPFSCTVTAEDARVNLNRASTEIAVAAPAGGVGQLGSSGGPTQAQIAAAVANQQRRAAQLYVQLGGLLRPMLQSGEIASEEELNDVILNVIDWTDADDNAADIDQTGNFVAGSGAESANYAQYGYTTKNARLDTVGEVQLVDGMTSDIYCQLREKLTVFSTDKVNVNDADLSILKGVLCQAVADDATRLALCVNPGIRGLPPMDEALIAMESCRELKKQVYSTPFTSMSKFTQFFQQFPNAMGTGIPLPINPSIVSQQLGVRTKMVRIEAEGIFGDTKRKMIAVVDTSTGGLVHFHYE